MNGQQQRPSVRRGLEKTKTRPSRNHLSEVDELSFRPEEDLAKKKRGMGWRILIKKKGVTTREVIHWT